MNHHEIVLQNKFNLIYSVVYLRIVQPLGVSENTYCVVGRHINSKMYNNIIYYSSNACRSYFTHIFLIQLYRDQMILDRLDRLNFF